MPAGGAVNVGLPGGDVIDLSVCITLLKKCIVLFPLFIMIIIFLIKVTLTHKPEYRQQQELQDLSFNLSMLNDTNLTIQDYINNKPSVILTVLTTNHTEQG